MITIKFEAESEVQSLDILDKLMVYTKDVDYPIYINDTFESLGSAFSSAGLEGRRVLIIADTNTSKLFGAEAAAAISGISDSVYTFVAEPGEDSKSLGCACEIYRYCIEKGLDRTSVILALGGGVVGDLAGFVAATYMRGVAYAQVPTTLLAQVDSSVGGKVAVNFGGLKNIVGAFYQPRFVYSNIAAIASLPRSEFLCGLAEAVKTGLAYDEGYLNFIIRNKDSISRLDSKTLAGVVCGSCKAKAEIVGKDEKEENLRRILNLGHTFGHGIETASEFSIPHGHAVAIGCMAALFLSLEKGRVTSEDITVVLNMYGHFGLPTSISGYCAEEIYEHMKSDKKNKNGMITVILLQGMGRAYSDTTLTRDEILRGLNTIIDRGE